MERRACVAFFFCMLGFVVLFRFFSNPVSVERCMKVIIPIGCEKWGFRALPTFYGFWHALIRDLASVLSFALNWYHFANHPFMHLSSLPAGGSVHLLPLHAKKKKLPRKKPRTSALPPSLDRSQNVGFIPSIHALPIRTRRPNTARFVHSSTANR